MRDLQLKPGEPVNTILAQAIAEKCFGIQASARELPSERDRNFLLDAADGVKFVLKIANRSEQREVVEAQNAMLEHLAERVSFCPRVVPSLAGDALSIIDQHLVRVLSYLPGKPLATIESQPAELLFDVGRKLGQLSCALESFDHEGAHRTFHWDLAEGSNVLRTHGAQIKSDWLRELVVGFAAKCRWDRLRKSVVHGDANDYNVLVERNAMVGLIDFGDIVYSYTVADLAIAVAYAVLGKDDPKTAAAPLIEGYREEFSLDQDELDALWPLVKLRLCMSVCHAARQREQHPENEYLGISQSLIEKTLPGLLAED